MSKTGNKDEVCSFCQKPVFEVGKLIAGPPDIYICDNCVEICNGILIGDKIKGKGKQPVEVGAKVDSFTKDVPTPQEMVSRLDEFVIGQAEAKKSLAVAVYNHYKRLQAIESDTDSEVDIEKSNVLMVGPTGCGKTLLARVLAESLNVPFAIADATTLTEAGYVGEDVENILLRLIQAADFDVPTAEKGIIYIDEIDKIGSTNQNRSITRDVSGAGVQQALLKMLEGTTANVPPQGGRKHPEQQYISINTRNILFICGGTFQGIEELVGQRIGKNQIGFSKNENSDELTVLAQQGDYDAIMSHLQTEDLVHYGMIPEMMGRLPLVTKLQSLKHSDLKRILREPKNALLRQYEKLFEMDDKQLVFTEDAVDLLAKKAVEVKTGARGLRSLTESVMLDIMYEAPSRKDLKEVIIDEEVINNGYDFKSSKKIKKAKKAKKTS